MGSRPPTPASLPSDGLYERLARMRDAFHAWQQEPWPLRPFAGMPRQYQAWSIGSGVLSVLGTVVILRFSDAPLHVHNMWVLILGVVIVARMSVRPLRENDMALLDVTLAVPFAMLLAGYHLEAMLAWVTAPAASRMRKPIVRHLFVLNICNISFFALALGTWFRTVAGPEAEPLSGTWLLAAFAMLEAYFILQLVWVYCNLALGGYLTFIGVVRSQVREIATTTLATFPLALLIGAALAHPNPLVFLFLVAPLALSSKVYERSDQLREVTEVSEHDPLTGLKNRRALMQTLGSINRTTIEDERMHIIMCDLDNFKNLNDTRGHDVGDRALIESASCIRSSVRQGDLCSRFGGEEFVVVLEDIGCADALDIAERIRATIESDLRTLSITVSIGVHSVTPEDDVMSMIKSADLAMYAAKTGGKNRVVRSRPLTDQDQNEPGAASAA